MRTRKFQDGLIAPNELLFVRKKKPGVLHSLAIDTHMLYCPYVLKNSILPTLHHTILPQHDNNGQFAITTTVPSAGGFAATGGPTLRLVRLRLTRLIFTASYYTLATLGPQ